MATPRHTRQDKGHWQIERERHRLDESAVPLPPFREAASIAPLIDRLMRKVGAEQDHSLNRIADLWPAIVGQAVAAHTRPARVDQGCLEIHVDHSIWLGELNRQSRPQILANLRKHLPNLRITRLMLRIDPDAGRPPG